MSFHGSVYAFVPEPPSSGGNLSVSFEPKGPDFAGLTGFTPSSVISGLISLILIVAVLVFFFTLVTGGLKWVTSGGDEKAVSAARSQITYAILGLIIVFVVWAVIKIIETVFGVSIFSGLTIPTL